jgi:hypothetical protein
LEKTMPRSPSSYETQIATCHQAIASRDAEIRRLRTANDIAIDETIRVVAALARLFDGSGFMVLVGDIDNPDWNEDWRRCVVLEGPTGQLSWSFHHRHDYLFENLLETNTVDWDGHNVDRMYGRLAALGPRALRRPQ